MWSGIWSVATTRISFLTWTWSTKTLWTGEGSNLLILMLEKVNWFRSPGLITLVLLMWKWMGLRGSTELSLFPTIILVISANSCHGAFVKDAFLAHVDVEYCSSYLIWRTSLYSFFCNFLVILSQQLKFSCLDPVFLCCWIRLLQ